MGAKVYLGIISTLDLNEEASPRADFDGEIGEPSDEEGWIPILGKRRLVDAHVYSPRKESLGFVFVARQSLGHQVVVASVISVRVLQGQLDHVAARLHSKSIARQRWLASASETILSFFIYFIFPHYVLKKTFIMYALLYFCFG